MGQQRPKIEDTMMAVAVSMGERSTCRRRRVGCVLVNGRNHILATGYNGVASGQTHCIDVACQGANQPSGSGLDLCEAIHAEQNALLQCSDVYSIDTCFTTTSPCIQCVKLLLNTSCKTIVFGLDYSQQRPKELWLQAGRNWIHYSEVTKALTG